MLDLIKKALVSGEIVLISGFGKFQVKTKKERKGRNPATGEDNDAGTEESGGFSLFGET